MAAALQRRCDMRLDEMLTRSRNFEEGAAALYRRWAATARDDPKLCALWTSLARDEEDHARAIATARVDMPVVRGWRTQIDGWEESLEAIDDRLRAAERLPAGAGAERQLAAALDLELTEMDALRLLLLDLAGADPEHEDVDTHACGLADAATAFTNDAGIALQAALIRARARMHGARAGARTASS
jgi:hypothetical protein